MSEIVRFEKVLRIGLVRGGRLVAEREVRAGDAVVLGVDVPVARGAGVTLAESAPDGWTLRVPDGATLRLRRGDVVEDVRGGQVALTGGERGRIRLGEDVVLLRVERARPVVELPPRSFRPPLIDEDDAPFLGFTGWFTALAAVLLVWVSTAEPRTSTAEDLPPLVQQIAYVQPPIEPPEAAVEEEAPPAPVEEEEAPPAKPERREEPVAGTPAERRREKLEQVRERSALFRGFEKLEGVGGLLGEDDGAPIPELLYQTGEGRPIAAAGDGPRAGSSQVEDRGLGELGRADAGGTDVATGPEVRVRSGEVIPDLPPPGTDGGDELVARVLRERSRDVRYCYQLRLKEVPSLAGRLEIAFSIRGGVVGDVRIPRNTTGDEALERCVMERVRRWSFPKEVSREVTRGFVLRPAE